MNLFDPAEMERRLRNGYIQNLEQCLNTIPVNRAEAELNQRRIAAANEYLRTHP